MQTPKILNIQISSCFFWLYQLKNSYKISSLVFCDHSAEWVELLINLQVGELFCFSSVFSILKTFSWIMKCLTKFYQYMINYFGDINILSVFVIIILSYIFLMLMWKRLLRRSKREHDFGQSLLFSDEAPKVIKVKLVWLFRYSCVRRTGSRLYWVRLCESKNLHMFIYIFFRMIFETYL